MSDRTVKSYGATTGSAPQPSTNNSIRGYRHIDNPNLDTSTPRRAASIEGFQEAVEESIARFKRGAMAQVASTAGDRWAQRVATFHNIRRHQANLHGGTSALSAMGTLASVAKKIPEPHVQAAGRAAGAAVSVAQSARVANDLRQPGIRAQGQPLMTSSGEETAANTPFEEL